MKLELKDSRNILRESWITKVLTGLFNFCKFFCSKCLQKQGSVFRVWVWIPVQFLEDTIYYLFSPQWLGDYAKVDLYKNTLLLFIQLKNLSENLSMGNFSKFSTFSKFASFLEEPIWLWRANVVINVDEIVFSQNHIFNKKWNSYVNIFLVLCLTPFVVDVTVITLLLSQIYVLRKFLPTV